MRSAATCGLELSRFTGTGDGGVVAGQRVEIRAGRVVLREVLPAEAGRLVDGGPRDRSWADGYPLPGTLPPARALMAQDHDGQWRPGFGMYQIVLPAPDGAAEATVIGDIGFHTAPLVGSVEIGYGIVPIHRGHGYVTEAVNALTAWALAQPGVSVVRAETEPDNVASQNVLVRAGFVLVDVTAEARRYHRSAIRALA
jgi:RimJ/RimL family protein N-acetyltransferase